MAQSAFVPGRWVRLPFALVLLLALVLPQAAHAAPSQGSQQTRYFTILYPAGEEKTAEWYASFADDVNVSVSELLGADPVTGLTLHIYATEREYQEANPMAGLIPGIMAHAIPEQKEIGVAVERLRQQPPELARTSFRHEITHIVAGALSNQNLPLGFNEGLAQYNELSDLRGEEVVQVMQAAEANGEPPMSWRALNERRSFYANIDLAYAQSYSVMAFLADRYGMGKFSRFLASLHDYRSWRDALNDAYGVPVDTLETEWRGYLTGFFKDGWKHNVLAAYDLAPGVALYDAGQFSDARDRFVESEKLYNDLGRTERAAEAAAYRAKAEQAEAAAVLTTEARQALETYDYATAGQRAAEAGQTFTTLNLPEQQRQATEVADLAQSGLAALATLQRAREARQRLDLAQAQAAAREAGLAFAALGDTARMTEADAILADLWRWQRYAGLAVVGVGLAVVFLALLALLRARRFRPVPIAVGEETPSWL
jgi:hypothetical protein